jgi:predicted nucleic acid-binding protein
VILVDTSVWIEVFRTRNPLDLEAIIDFDDIVTCLPVVQEVLQGFRDESAFLKARQAMFSMPIVENPLTSEVFDYAVDLYRDARSAGISIRSSVDCLIGACAIRNNLQLVHRDRDFDELAKITRLRSRRIDA